MFDDFFDVLFAAGYSGNFDKFSLPLLGYNAGEGGFASAGGTPKDEVDGLLVLDDLGEDLAVADEMGLADDIRKTSGTETFGEGDAVRCFHRGIIPYFKRFGDGRGGRRGRTWRKIRLLVIIEGR